MKVCDSVFIVILSPIDPSIVFVSVVGPYITCRVQVGRSTHYLAPSGSGRVHFNKAAAAKGNRTKQGQECGKRKSMVISSPYFDRAAPTTMMLPAR